MSQDKERIILHNAYAPGDYTAGLVALDSLHRQFPDRFLTDYHTICPWVYQHQTYLTRLKREEARVIRMETPEIDHLHQRQAHIGQAQCEWLGEQLRLPLKQQVTIPTIHLSRQEMELPALPRTWVINAGFKKDCAAKWWGHSRYQRVVELLPDIQFIQLGEDHPNHSHTPLKGRNVRNMIGKTMDRGLIALCSQVEGGIGGVTFLQHVMAGLGKAYVCLNTREQPWYTSYPRQTMFSTCGKIACSPGPVACWASDLEDTGEGRNRCKLPVLSGGELTPGCAALITPEMVADAVRSYDRGRELTNPPTAKPPLMSRLWSALKGA